MKRLGVPAFQELELFDACVSEMEEMERAAFVESRPHMQAVAEAFATESTSQTWCRLQKARHGHAEDIVAGSLSKGTLTDLYSISVVKSKGRPRNIYDKILVAAEGKCPYCAGIGAAETLDHYLPKARFPALSVHPLNLVPACYTCNKGAGADFPVSPSLQPIHPYLDKDCFFSERWIHAKVIPSQPVVVIFQANPPDDWSIADQRRARQHFKGCDLGNRFSIQVAGEIGPLIRQRKSSLAVFSRDQFAAHLRVVAEDNDLLLNGWKRTMYLALCESDWFCSVDFDGF